MTTSLIWVILGLGFGGCLTRVLDKDEPNKVLYAVLGAAAVAAILVLKFYVKL